jgi:hypothetical protein
MGALQSSYIKNAITDLSHYGTAEPITVLYVNRGL